MRPKTIIIEELFSFIAVKDSTNSHVVNIDKGRKLYALYIDSLGKTDSISL